ncbi:hypothetical protein NDU88_000947 [Pleurodeles waltl]|uniref:Uncharacterized protein n=1 Tax=Pleurodeles waltl TaxID=8319 RepID=A0AAV7U5J4_PLEWA|nr:hypothetical protein NDU88_000947 [Pleurodeles waltl]
MRHGGSDAGRLPVKNGRRGSKMTRGPGCSASPQISPLPVPLLECTGLTGRITLRCWSLAPQERPAAVERRARDGAL